MALTAKRVSNAPAGTHQDGRGLRLVVSKSGVRRWVLRYQLKGKRRDMGLGGWPAVSLADAREAAEELRRKIARGVDPLDEAAGATRMTVAEAAAATIEYRKSGWKSPRQAAIWQNSLDQYVLPTLGRRDIESITVGDVLGVLKPIWTRIPETASRIRSRMEIVCDYAGTLRARSGENPCRWRGNLEHLLPNPKKVRSVVHHPALPYRDIPDVMQRLLAKDSVSARCLAFAILTAARSGEARGATWEEIDIERRTWIIPPARMKAKDEHRVPLTDATLAVMGTPGRGLIFPSPVKPNEPLSDMGLAKPLKSLGLAATVHGMRSSFRDWAGETTEFAREVVERCMSHGPLDQVERAYARGNLMERRRKVMEAWSAFAMSTAAAQDDQTPAAAGTGRKTSGD